MQKHTITIYVRLLPLKDKKEESIIKISDFGENYLSINTESTKNMLECTKIFDDSAKQIDVFACFKGLVKSSLVEGENFTAFAFGGSGSGKTHTLYGTNGDQGIVPRIVDYLFSIPKEMNAAEKVGIAMKLLAYHIEQEKLTYLSGINDNHQVTLPNPEMANKLIIDALKKRTTMRTPNNLQSSRSHFILTLFCELTMHKMGVPMKCKSKITFVDLAGNEKINDYNSKIGIVGTGINLSLLYLTNAMRAIAKQQVVTYNNTTLTIELKDVLNDKTRLCVLGTISQSSGKIENTKATINFLKDIKMTKVIPKQTKKVSTEEQLKELSIKASIYKEMVLEHAKIDRLPKEKIQGILEKYNSLGPAVDEEIYSIYSEQGKDKEETEEKKDEPKKEDIEKSNIMGTSSKLSNSLLVTPNTKPSNSRGMSTQYRYADALSQIIESQDSIRSLTEEKERLLLKIKELETFKRTTIELGKAHLRRQRNLNSIDDD